MRRCVLVFLLLALTQSLIAQTGNEWIDHGQPYYRIPIAADGIYRLTYSQLTTAGLPASEDPRNFRLFHRGVEQSIFVEGESDGQFNSTDFIEFYGRRNDGTLDTELYISPAAQPHRLHNLYCDTTYYFLTVGPVNGKRMNLISEPNPGAAPLTHHWDEKSLVLKSQYSSGINFGEIQQTVFDQGEGWMGNQITQNQTGTYQLDGIIKTFAAGGVPKLEILLTGRGPMSHSVELYSGTRLISTVTFSGYASYKHIQDIEWTDITSDGKLSVSVKVIGVAGLPDRASVGYIKLRYPQAPDMEAAGEKIFQPEADADNAIVLEIQNPPTGTRVFDVTDPTTIKRVNVSLTSTLNVVLPASSVEKKLLATHSFQVPEVRKISFRTFNPGDYNFVIITHPALRKPASGYTDPVKAYGEYRSLPAGGGYDTLIANIDQLYDQFNYGEKSPLAIIHFLKFLNTAALPDYLFIIGKGLDVNYGYYRNPAAYTTYKDLVPTAGYPASDQYFSAGLSGLPHATTIATGRLSASTPQDVAAYLNKVKETEALPFDDLRRKHILHLSGGIYEGEPQLFRSFLAEYADVAESYYLGGKVTAIAKQSTDIEVINVADQVNNGVSLITFFGHSAATTTDFDIGNVTDPAMGYHNKGKYPVLLMNGCSSGSFFLNASIFGENWTNTAERGAVGVIAHSSFGFAGQLKDYSSLFYQSAFGDSLLYNKGLGDVQAAVAQQFLSTYGDSPREITQVQQMVLLGDPSFRIFPATKPDYEINSQNFTVTSFNGEPVTALTDSFKVTIVVRNFGRASEKTFRAAVERKLADNSVLTYDTVFSSVLYSDTLSFVVPFAENGYGNNSFTVTIDADNDIEELNETNNVASFQFFIPVSGTRNLFPADFAIVNTTDLNLTFQHTDQLSGISKFILELDSVNTFDSPFLKQHTIAANVLATQSVSVSDKDTVAYYWRTKLVDPTDEDSVIWNTSSFTYIKDGDEGWAQVRFPQFSKNTLTGLVADPELESLEFRETVTDIAIKTFGSAAGKPIDSVSLRINGAEYNILSESGCRNNTINLVAFDKKTAHPYPGIYFTFQQIAQLYGGKRLICGREPYVINSYRADELVMGNDGDIIRYIDNIPQGDSVILFNIGNPGYELWPAGAITKLGELGISADQIAGLLSGEPVVIATRKGATPGSALIHKTSSSPEDTQSLVVNGSVTGRFTAGEMQSSLIGPALRWKNFYSRFNEAGSTDEVNFDIIGIKSSGEEETILSALTDDTDISSIEASIYPFIKISFHAVDNTLVTAAQMRNWIVTYEPVAEGVLLYRGPAAPQSVHEGEAWNAQYAFVNISNSSFTDSVTVRHKILNTSGFSDDEHSINIARPAPGDTTTFVVSFATVGQDGVNSLEVFANPYLIPEQNYNNNVIPLNDYLSVIPDLNAPVLDVTFDGRHLVNNDFVSPSPDIRITLWDNNPFMLRADTTGMAILISYPCTDEVCNFQRVAFSSSEIVWHPETDTSEFVVGFKPVDLPDGKYTLRVEANDLNGNPSGPEPYSISFQVAHDGTIVVMGPYPNPFSDKMNFDFSASGGEIPGVKLTIVDISGRPVFNAFMATDNFHIGSNQFTWNGRDSNGNILPPGIYHYRFSVFTSKAETTSSGKIVLK